MTLRSSPQGGFTLLELMCAFGILATVTAFMTVAWSESMEKAGRAIDQRELREVADTVFGRILFEESEHGDGDTGTLDVLYGHWANLPQAKRDRYAIYRYELDKERVTAAGPVAAQSGAPSLFDTDSEDEERGRFDTGSETPGAGDESSEEDAGDLAVPVELWKVTLRIYREGEGDGEPLIVLQTYRRPTDLPAVGGRAR